MDFALYSDEHGVGVWIFIACPKWEELGWSVGLTHARTHAHTQTHFNGQQSRTVLSSHNQHSLTFYSILDLSCSFFTFFSLILRTRVFTFQSWVNLIILNRRRHILLCIIYAFHYFITSHWIWQSGYYQRIVHFHCIWSEVSWLWRDISVNVSRTEKQHFDLDLISGFFSPQILGHIYISQLKPKDFVCKRKTN